MPCGFAACGGVAPWGGAVGLAPWGWRRGVGGALAYPTRRAALRVFGAGARAVRRLGCRPVAAVARGGVGIFV